MKQVLKYDGKHGDQIWDASTPALEEKAKKELFKFLDKDFLMFEYIEKDAYKTVEEKCKHCGHVKSKKVKAGKTPEYQDYEKAKKGDMYYINRMLNEIKNHEYGYWEIESVN